MSNNLKREEALKLLNTMKALVKKGNEIIIELERLLELDNENQVGNTFDIFVQPGNMCRHCLHCNGSVCTEINRGCEYNPLI